MVSSGQEMQGERFQGMKTWETTLLMPAVVSVRSSCSRGLARDRRGCTCTGFTGRWGQQHHSDFLLSPQNVFSLKITQFRAAALPLYLLWPEDTETV